MKNTLGEGGGVEVGGGGGRCGGNPSLIEFSISSLHACKQRGKHSKR